MNRLKMFSVALLAALVLWSCYASRIQLCKAACKDDMRSYKASEGECVCKIYTDK